MALVDCQFTAALIRAGYGLDSNASPDVVRHVRGELDAIIAAGGVLGRAVPLAARILTDLEVER